MLSEQQFGKSCDCHGQPTYKNRCSVSGHREPWKGMNTPQTRDLMKKNPGFLITELRGRRAAKKAGKNAQ